MRVAYVCADRGVPVYGQKGSSVHVQEIIRALLHRGAQVELFAGRVDGAPPEGLESVRVHQLSATTGSSQAERERQAMNANEPLARALLSQGPWDIVYERYSLWSFAGMEHARRKRAAGILEVNAPLIEEQAEHRGLVHRRLAEETAERAFAASDLLLAVSQGVADYLAGFPGTTDHVHVVPNGVNLQRFTAGLSPAVPRDPGSFTVGFLGTLKPWHGMPVLVEAFALLHQQRPQARLLVVGDGPERGAVLSDAEQRGLSSAVRLVGAVSPEAVPACLASLDVAVAPYPSLSNFYFSPLKIYEYMAAGLPVVASAIGQIPEILHHGVSGLLCPPGNVRAFAEALIRLCDDLELRERLGRAARAQAVRCHSWDSVVERILHLAKLSAAAPAETVAIASR